LERVGALIQQANRLIYDRASSDPSASGMGTTMTVALVEGMTVLIGHVGDSRAYLVRGDSMEQLTEDHSIVNELVKSGQRSEKAVRSLVQFANKEGGEDNITAVAFRISAGSPTESAEPASEDTVTMPAVSDAGEPDERTPESVDVPPSAEIAPRRVRLVLAGLI